MTYLQLLIDSKETATESSNHKLVWIALKVRVIVQDCIGQTVVSH